MNVQIRKFGLIGYPLGHSFSKGHFSRKFAQEHLKGCFYDNFEIADASLLTRIVSDHPELVGLNVTIPHKKAVIPFLDELDPVSSEIGAVNTIKILRSTAGIRLKGYNTDVTGFTRSLEKWRLSKNVKALVFGTGGSSQAVKYSLERMDIAYISISRSGSAGTLAYSELTEEMAREYRLWINTTPVGMFPNVGNILPLPFHGLTHEHYLFDLIYNPEITEFLRLGSLAGAKVMNGSTMLYEQAEASWAIWNSQP